MSRKGPSGQPGDAGAGASGRAAVQGAALRGNGEADVAAIVREAVRRDSLENLRAGKRLIRGRWVAREDYLKTRLRSRLRDVLLMIEAIAFWGVVAAIGLACLLVLTLIM